MSWMNLLHYRHHHCDWRHHNFQYGQRLSLQLSKLKPYIKSVLVHSISAIATACVLKYWSSGAKIRTSYASKMSYLMEAEKIPSSTWGLERMAGRRRREERRRRKGVEENFSWKPILDRGPVWTASCQTGSISYIVLVSSNVLLSSASNVCVPFETFSVCIGIWLQQSL